MYNIEIIKQASYELNGLDKKEVVKVASVLQRIRNWFKMMMSPEFKGKVDKLRNESSQVRLHLKNLDKYLSQIETSIKNGDEIAYAQSLENVTRSAELLAQQLGELNVSIQEGPPPPQLDIKPGKSNLQLPEDIVPVGGILGGEDLVYNDNFSNSIHIRKIIVGNMINSGIDKESAIDALNNNEFWELLKQATASGKVLDVQYRKQSINNDKHHLSGDYIYYVQTPKIVVPNVAFEFQAIIEVVDHRYNTNERLRGNYKVMKFIRKLIPIRVGPTNRSRVKDITASIKRKAKAAPWYLDINGIRLHDSQYNKSNKVQAIRTTVSKADLISALKNVWPSLFPDIQMSDRGFEVLWAKIALETGNMRSMMNYNLGNVKCTPNQSQSSKFTGFPCGENLPDANGQIRSIKFTSEHPMCYFRAFDSLEEGVKFYLSFLGQEQYRDALMAAVSGDPTEFANKLKEAGYYTASASRYAKGLRRLMVEEDKNKTPSVVSTTNDEIPQDVKMEATELAQALGLNISFASMPLTQMVVNAISEEMLPINDVKVIIKADNLSSMMEYGYILSNALSRTIDADTDICSDGKHVEVTCSTTGNTKTIINAVAAIDDVVAKAFQNKYKKIVVSSVREGKSKYSIVGEIKLERHRRKFALKEITNVS